MKTVLPVFLCFLMLFYNCKAFSQVEPNHREIKIDPRQYVTVQYKKTPTNGKLDTIWNWETRKNVPNQKFTFIDIDGEIKIDFNKFELISNTDFEGTVSLEAEISGVNGTRKIEVNPYSEIGINRRPIGTKSEPPSELAKKILNMITELRDAEGIYSTVFYYRNFSGENIIKNEIVEAKFKELDSLTHNPNSKIKDLVLKAVEFRRLIKNELDVFYFDDINEYGRRWDNNFASAKSNAQLQQLLDALHSNYYDVYKRERDSYLTDYNKAFKYSREELSVINNYLISFDNSGEDAVKAFLSLINKDYINYNAIKAKLLSYKTQVDNIQISNKNPDSAALVLYENSPLINEVIKLLSDFSRFKGSFLENILRELAKEKKSIDYNKRDIYPNYAQRDSVENVVFFSLLDSYNDFLIDTLSKAAARIIFRKLVYATIDLGKSGAKNGEVVNIYVNWILDSKRDSLSNSPRLPIGKYYLRETGWKVEVADMFALVKRIHESNVNQSKVSPSNFKGSGGAVLMWTYDKEDKGIVITKQNRDYKVTKKNKFLNFFEPSIGLNISYLDFSIEKDVEIGTGLQLGFFRNKIFFGYGVNLHMLSPKNQAPTYFYLGFSFAKLSDLFKSSNNITSLQ